MIDPLDERDTEILLGFAGLNFPNLGGSSIVITGATGFIGRWVLASLSKLAVTRNLDFEVHVLARNVERARSILGPIVDGMELDVMAMEDYGRIGSIEHLWHFAAHTGGSGPAGALEIIEADTGVTLSLLDLASSQPSPPRMLYTSSGAVYGRGRRSSLPVDEATPVICFESTHPYDASKGASELVLAAASADGVIDLRIARLFALVGPLLPLGGHFAIGNFIADAAANRTVVVKSGGVDHRSWMYAGDMANALLAVAFGDSPPVVNVGGRESMAISSAAARVAEIAEVGLSIEGDRTVQPTYYVPNVELLESSFSGVFSTSFDQSIIRTIEWARSSSSRPLLH